MRNSLSPTSCSRDIRARVLVDETLSRSPSFRDWDHYGDSMITLDLLYDMEKFRRERGALFVNWDDVKPLDRRHRNTDRDEIGCYMGPNPFEGGVSSCGANSRLRGRRLICRWFAQRSFDEHNLDQTIWHVKRHGPFPESAEAFVLWDFDEATRLKETKEYAEREKRKLPANMEDSRLLCYSNLWDLSHAGAQATGWTWSEDFAGLQRESGEMTELLAPNARGTHPGKSPNGRVFLLVGSRRLTRLVGRMVCHRTIYRCWSSLLPRLA